MAAIVLLLWVKAEVSMERGLVMAGICVVLVIGLAWWMDAAHKEAGSLLALAVFAVMGAVAYFKRRNASGEKRPRFMWRDR